MGLSLKEAVEQGRMPPFIAEQEAQHGPSDPAEFDRIVAFPVMLLVSLVLGFIFDRMTRTMFDQLSNPRLPAFCRHLVENRKHDAHIASSRRADRLSWAQHRRSSARL